LISRARRRKKLAKALERQARKLRAKGITVDLEALRNEYLSQHRINASDTEGEEDEDDEDDNDNETIDVVGGESDDGEPEDFSMKPHRKNPADDVVGNDRGGQTTNLRPTNPFSIESLLYNNT
jgi:homeobox protein Unc-4